MLIVRRPPALDMLVRDRTTPYLISLTSTIPRCSRSFRKSTQLKIVLTRFTTFEPA